MSRIGKLPIKLPLGVTITVANDNTVKIKGSLGELTQKVDPDIKVVVENGELLVQRPTEQKRHKALHGLYRSLLNNMVEGVSKGFEIKQEIIGVGYRATATGQTVEFALGYSHLIYIVFPDEIKVETEAKKGQIPSITIKGIDKQLLGQVAAKIRSLRKPEPYKGKGIKFAGEVLRRKAGKAAAV